MPSSKTASAPPPNSLASLSSLQQNPHFRAAVARGVHQVLRHKGFRVIPIKTECNGRWRPRMDLVDDPASPNIMAILELPGVKIENIKVQIIGGRLVVVGHRADPFAEALATAASASSNPQAQASQSNNADQNQHVKPKSTTSAIGPFSTGSSSNTSLRELRYGSFLRSIAVPEGINQSEVIAGIQDGMLTVTWPRVPKAARQSVTSMSAGPSSTNTSPNPVNLVARAMQTSQASGVADTATMVQ